MTLEQAIEYALAEATLMIRTGEDQREKTD